MATEFTPNYNLDKYTANDKPNLRDQYNAAMDKIDLALLSANTNATEAKAATQSFAGDIEAKADQTDLDALAAIIPDTDFSAQNTVKAALDAKASNTALNTALQSEANTRASADTAINNKLAQIFVPKYMVCIGDSFTYSQGGYSGVPYWHAYVAKALGVTVKNFASGSTGFIEPSTSNRNFRTQIAEASADTTFSNNDVAYVIIYGGVNDGATLSQNYVYNTIVAAENAFPNAKVFTFFNYNAINDNAFTQRRSIINTLARGHGRRVNTLWLCERCATFPHENSSDSLHPSETGSRLIACEMLSYINGGRFDILDNARGISVTAQTSGTSAEVRGTPHVTSRGVELAVQTTITGATPTTPFTGSISILLNRILTMDVQGAVGDKGFTSISAIGSNKEFDDAGYKLTASDNGTVILVNTINQIALYSRLTLLINGQ